MPAIGVKVLTMVPEPSATLMVGVTDAEAMAAGKLCAELEGIIPAIETAHALAHLEKMVFTGKESVVICLSGRGDKDLDTYMKYFNL